MSTETKEEVKELTVEQKLQEILNRAGYARDGDGKWARLTIHNQDWLWMSEKISQLAQLTRENSALREALIDVLNTGLNGGNDVRLAYMAASQKVLTPELLAQAEASEVACVKAHAALDLCKK